MQGVFDNIVDKVFNGDLYTVFKPLDLQLHGYHSKDNIVLNIPNRMSRRIEFGLLEVVTESSSESVDWRLKLNGISVTKEFKPHYMVRYKDRLISKFVYDVTSLLNTEESMRREWVNLTVKHEGGSPVKLRKIQLVTLYEDTDASTSLKYWTGLLVLYPGESYPLAKCKNIGGHGIRISSYIPQKTSRLIMLINGMRHELMSPHTEGFEEYIINNINTSLGDGEIALANEGEGGAVIASSIILYSIRMPIPVIEVEDINASRVGGQPKIIVSLMNKGESSPDFIVFTVLHKGSMLTSMKINKPLKPGERSISELVIPSMVKTGETVTLRIVWSKLSRTWFTEKQILVP